MGEGQGIAVEVASVGTCTKIARTVHVLGMTGRISSSDTPIPDADLALVRAAAAKSVDNAPPLSDRVAARVASHLWDARDAARNAS